MLKNNLHLLLFVTFCLIQINLHSYSQQSNLFEKANANYDSANYEMALKLYDSIQKTGYYSSELYYNMGNCAYKLDQIGYAIYYFEKSLKYNSQNEDAIHNLKKANQYKIDKSTATNSISLSQWVAQFFGFNYNLWAWISVSFSFTFALLIITIALKKPNFLYLFAKPLMVVSFIGIIITFAISYTIYKSVNATENAIIIEPSATIYNEPSQSSSAAFNLHEGSKVIIIEQNNDFYKINFENKVGWIAKTYLKII